MSVSKNTLDNWKRLKRDGNGRLTKRANKSRSPRLFIPRNLLKKESLALTERICAYIRDKGLSPEIAVNSVCLNELDRLPQTAGVRRLTEEAESAFDEELRNAVLPAESDAVGLIYQSVLAEGAKSELGSYYTSEAVAAELLKDVKGVLLDPACGSGSFLLSSGLPPERLIGVDKDPLAVRIAKTNMFKKFAGYDFEPDIRCEDFLEGSYRADTVATNPPWGGRTENAGLARIAGTTESYALFAVKALSVASEVRLLLPESLISAVGYAKLRNYLKDRLYKIVTFGRVFDQVLSKAMGIFLSDAPGEYVSLVSDGKERLLPRRNFGSEWTFCDEADLEEIESYYRVPHVLLDADFAMGIVTGDNAGTLREAPFEGGEPVITGKDIERYVIKKPRYYIRYDRENFQQSVPEKCFRQEKLVYKFISHRPVFAYDGEGRLTLNNANFLVPRGMNIKYVLAVLNSSVTEKIYRSRFRTEKVLKSNLKTLPIPLADEQIQREIAAEVDLVIAGKPDKDLDEKVRKIFSGEMCNFPSR